MHAIPCNGKGYTRSEDVLTVRETQHCGARWSGDDRDGHSMRGGTSTASGGRGTVATHGTDGLTNTDADNALIYERAARALMIAFLSLGFPIGVLITRLAEIKADIGATTGSFGTALAVGGVGALLGTNLGSRLVHAFGSRTVALATVSVQALTVVSNALVPNVAAFTIVSFSFAALMSVTNVGVNSQAVLIEQHLGRSFVPRAHGMWSVGTFGASLVSSLAAPYVSPLVALVVAATLSLALFFRAGLQLLPPHLDDRPHDDPTQLPRTERMPKGLRNFLFLLAVAQTLGLAAEMTVGDWGAVLLHEDFGVAIGRNGLGFTVFMGVMSFVRFFSPRYIDRFGLDRVIRTLAISGAIGFAAMLTVARLVAPQSADGALVAMCVGYVFMAFAVGAMPPAFTTAAGRINGLPSARAIAFTASVVSIVNIALRLAFAQIADAVGLPYALYLASALVITTGLMASMLHPAKAEAHAIQR